MLHDDYRQMLLGVARRSIEHGFRTRAALPVSLDDFPGPLREIRGTFVTLRQHSMLRGCIGTTSANSPLVVSVAENAYAAAFRDPRFTPLKREEYKDTHVSISILTLTEPIEFSSESDLLRQLRPGIDGLIIEKDGFRATFLPSVWSALPEPEEFLLHLKNKASIPANLPPARAWCYQAESIDE